MPGTSTLPGRAGARDIVQLTTVLVDLDQGDIEGKRAQLVDHLGAPSLEVASGGITDEGQTKRHLYWRLTEPAESEDLALVCRLRGAIAEEVCGDPAFGSAHQPVRVARSVYGKQGSCRPVRILEHSMREVELAELAEAVLAMPVMPGCRDGAATTAGPGPKAAELRTRRIREGRSTRSPGSRRSPGSSGSGSAGRARAAAVSKGLGTRSPTTILPELRHPFRKAKSAASSSGVPPRRRQSRPVAGGRAAGSGRCGPGDHTPKSVPPEASEDALADRFRLRHGSDWRYVALWGSWLGWNGMRWREDETNSQLDLVPAALPGSRGRPRQACRGPPACLAEDHRRSRADRSKRSGACSASRRLGPRSDVAEHARGIIDLSTGHFAPNDRAARMTSVAGVPPAAPVHAGVVFSRRSPAVTRHSRTICAASRAIY